MAEPDIKELIQQAGIASSEGRLEDAVSLYNSVLEREETRVEAHEGLANCYFRLKNYEKSLEHFQRLSRLMPREPGPYVNMGAVYNRLKDYKKAVDVLRKALTKDSKSAEAYYNLGLAYRSQNQLNLAISSYKEATKLAPQMADAFFNLANVQRESGRKDQAIKNYKKTLEIDPGFQRAQDALNLMVQDVAVEANSANPFGRLVDETKIVRKAQKTWLKELNDEERAEDRAKLKALAKQADKSARELLEFLRTRYEPIVHQLSQTVSTSMDSQHELVEAFEQFHSSLETLQTERRALKRKMLELRGHEELQNTPPLEELMNQ